MGICSRIQGSLYFLRLQSRWNAAGGKKKSWPNGSNTETEDAHSSPSCLRRLWFKTSTAASHGTAVATLLPLTTKKYSVRLQRDVCVSLLLCFNIFQALIYIFSLLDHQHWGCRWVYREVLPHGAEICSLFWQMISFSLIWFQLLNHTSPFGV